MRIFISHSSKDKERYCNAVVKRIIEQIGADKVVYDALTFEAGEKALDEINRTLQITDLFVILLSQEAVKSKWVQYELREAYQKLNDQTLNRVYPLIIDPNLAFSDPLIPEWLVKDYNLKYIARPNKTAKLIVERAKNINWSRHPDLCRRDAIFVGRNEIVNSFEIRNDDFDQPTLNTFIVSGLPEIGRKSLARYCLSKGSIIQKYYDFPVFSLSYQESIEDFIIKLNDLGFTEEKNIRNLVNKPMEDKIKCAVELSAEISSHTEIVLIKDDGCVVDYKGDLAEWFQNVVKDIALSERMIFIVITKYRVKYESMRHTPQIFSVETPELNRQERNGLLKRLAEVNHLSLTRQDYELISSQLTGYPAQVKYAIEIIKNQGYPYLKNNFKLLSNFNEQQVSSLLEMHKDDNRVMQILALIAKYDAISVTMLYQILSATPEYIECYEKLYQHSFFDLEGVNKEYVRLNEVVRNYVLRSGMKVLPEHQRIAQQLLEEMFSDENTTWYNCNDFLLAIRESVIKGKRIQTEDIIPSVYLKSMSDLYSDMQFENVLRLAELALDNTQNTDGRVLYEIRYLQCSALAKLKRSSFLNEVKKLQPDHRNFLTAFYYRQVGKNDRALEFLNILLTKKPDMSKAKREKVLVLKNLQEFEEAMELAKENYYLYSDNPYHIQAYFDCLINTYRDKPQDVLLGDLLEKLDRIQSEKARSMYRRCNAQYLAYVERDYDAAIREIDLAREEFPMDKKYALTIKFDIARLFHKTEVMQDVVKILEVDGSNSNNSFVICKSRLMADQGEVKEAIDYFLKHITFFTDESKKSFCEKLKNNL